MDENGRTTKVIKDGVDIDILSIEPRKLRFGKETNNQTLLIRMNRSIGKMAIRIKLDDADLISVSPNVWYMNGNEEKLVNIEWNNESTNVTSQRLMIFAIPVANESIPINEYWESIGDLGVFTADIFCIWENSIMNGNHTLNGNNLDNTNNEDYVARSFVDSNAEPKAFLNESFEQDANSTRMSLEHELDQIRIDHGSDGERRVEELLKLGTVRLGEGKVKEGLDCYTRAYLLSKANSSARARSLVGLGSVFEVRKETTQAVDSYLAALKIYIAENNENCQIAVIERLGGLYTLMQDYELAAAWYTLELSIIGGDLAHRGHRHRIKQEISYVKKLGKVVSLDVGDYKIKQLLASVDESYFNVQAKSWRTVKPNRKDTISLMWESYDDQTESITIPVERASLRRQSAPNYGYVSYLQHTESSTSRRSTKHMPPIEPSPTPPPTVLQPAYYVNSPRNKIAADSHLARILDAQRRRDVFAGVSPPKVDVANEKPSPKKHATLDVRCEFNGLTYTVDLPGTIRVARSMSIRDIRGAIAYQLGLDKKDFVLYAHGEPLSDSWCGRDIDVGEGVIVVELRLKARVDPSRYTNLEQRPLDKDVVFTGMKLQQATFTMPTTSPLVTPEKKKSVKPHAASGSVTPPVYPASAGDANLFDALKRLSSSLKSYQDTDDVNSDTRDSVLRKTLQDVNKELEESKDHSVSVNQETPIQG